MGYHIALLIMSALRYLAPQFLEEGRLCWLRSPLYIVENAGKESYYYTDEEMNAAKPKGIISRNKGLGSLSADRARRSMFSDEFQRMDTIMPTADALFLLEQLMGEPVEPRREFIFNEVDFAEIHE